MRAKHIGAFYMCCVRLHNKQAVCFHRQQSCLAACEARRNKCSQKQTSGNEAHVHDMPCHVLGHCIIASVTLASTTAQPSDIMISPLDISAVWHVRAAARQLSQAAAGRVAVKRLRGVLLLWLPRVLAMHPPAPTAVTAGGLCRLMHTISFAEAVR